MFKISNYVFCLIKLSKFEISKVYGLQKRLENLFIGDPRLQVSVELRGQEGSRNLQYKEVSDD